MNILSVTIIIFPLTQFFFKFNCQQKLLFSVNIGLELFDIKFCPSVILQVCYLSSNNTMHLNKSLREDNMREKNTVVNKEPHFYKKHHTLLGLLFCPTCFFIYLNREELFLFFCTYVFY